MFFKRKVYKYYSKLASPLGGIYILSAVRTPIGFLKGVLSEFTAPQLGSFAIKEALQRGLVPSKEIQKVFLGYDVNYNCHEEIMKRTGLSKSTEISFSTSEMKSLLEAVSTLQKENSRVALAGGMQSLTNSSSAKIQFFLKQISIQDERNFIKNYNDYIKVSDNEAFCDEIVEIDFRKRGQHIMVTEDEISKISDNAAEIDSALKSVPGDGAAVLLLSTEEYLKKNNLTPLGKVISLATESSNSGDLASAIEKALKAAKCHSEDIGRWEIASPVRDVLNCMNHFNIDCSQVNKDVGTLNLGYQVGMSGVRTICHLIHLLSAGELGCAASCDSSGMATAVIIKKMAGHKMNKPQLTLYTSQCCSLCDELKQQLNPFAEKFSLKEINIEAKGNEKFKELYQYEIPVLFLDGIFLCKHKLDVQKFYRRLLVTENSAG